jgi:hypothetical protein
MKCTTKLLTVLLVPLTILLVSCAPRQPNEATSGKELVPPAPNTDGSMRILLYCLFSYLIARAPGPRVRLTHVLFCL